jgi:hypothetical protein
MTSLTTKVHEPRDWQLESEKSHTDPWTAVTVAAIVDGPNGYTARVPAFWAGGRAWTVRFSATVPGTYRLRSECSEPHDRGLHGQTTVLEVTPSTPTTALAQHGPVRVRGRSFEHHDQTPFFWLGDTWWMLMSDRVSFPADFGALVANRVAKGFTVAQVVLGFPSDTTPYDGRESNEGGPPWEKEYARINPRYFDHADARIRSLVERGIVPCILGGWGYHLSFMGEERMTHHWRYLVARYAALPVVWCLAGEGAMPYYLSKGDPVEESKRQRSAWSRVAKVVRAIDPFRRPLTMHPRSCSWEDVEDAADLDFHMLQAGHLPTALEGGVALIEEARKRFADRPVINDETRYEGHMGTNGADVQRYAFWSTMLSGAAGFTYGAAGIFQANDRERPTGNRPDGGAFDSTFWDEAIQFPGATQIGLAKALLAELPFERFEPHPEWFSAVVRWGGDQYRPPFRVYGAGVPGECRVAYVPLRYYHWDGPEVRGIEPSAMYWAMYFDPITGRRIELGAVTPEANGTWKAPTLPVLQDWVLVLRRSTS